MEKVTLGAIGDLLDEKLKKRLEGITLKAIGELIDEKLDQRLNIRFDAFEKQFEKKIDEKLDQKFDQKLGKNLSKVKALFEPRFKKIEGTLDRVCVTVADLVVTTNEMKVDLADVKETVHHHSTSLDWLVKKYKDFGDEKTVINYRMGKFETTLRYVADEANVDIEDKLD
jgi:hypothetical protein